MLARPLARAMLASWFVSRGLDAVRHPADHVDESLPVLRTLADKASGPVDVDVAKLLDERTMRRVVQLHGAVTALTGISLVLGKAPRTAALVLAGLSVPILLGNLPLRVPGESREDRAARRERLVQSLTATGGAILAAVDREGRPGIAWRVGHARELRAEARAVRAEARASAANH